MALFVKAADVRPQVIVAAIVSMTGVEADLDLVEMPNKACSVVGHSPIPHDGHLGAIGLGGDGHLLHASAHGSSGDVLDISALMHVIVYTYEEEVVCLVLVDAVVLVVRPRQAMTVDCALIIAVIIRGR